MLNPKPLCVIIIVSFLLLGLYEKHSGDVVTVTHHFGRKAGNVQYSMMSGNSLIFFSLFLAAVATYVFRKE
jgi:hypothetical protein